MYRGVVRPYAGRPTYRMCASVSQRNKEPLLLLAAWFGGTVIVRKDATHPNTTYWGWSLTGARALYFLEAIFPFLVNKRHVASLGIEFGRWYLQTIPRQGYGMSEDRRIRAEQYWEECRRINRLYRDVPEPKQVVLSVPAEVAS